MAESRRHELLSPLAGDGFARVRAADLSESEGGRARARTRCARRRRTPPAASHVPFVPAKAGTQGPHALASGDGAPSRRSGHSRRRPSRLSPDRGLAAAPARPGVHRDLDRRGRPRRPAAAALHHRRRALAAAGDQGRRRSDNSSTMLIGYEDQRFCRARRRRLVGAGARRRPVRARRRAHRLRRLDADHAGGAPDRRRRRRAALAGKLRQIAHGARSSRRASPRTRSSTSI